MAATDNYFHYHFHMQIFVLAYSTTSKKVVKNTQNNLTEPQRVSLIGCFILLIVHTKEIFNLLSYMIKTFPAKIVYILYMVQP